MIKQILLAYGQGLTINGFEAIPADPECDTKAVTTDGPAFVYVLGFDTEPKYGDGQEPYADVLFLATNIPGVPPTTIDKRILREPKATSVPELPDLEPPGDEVSGEDDDFDLQAGGSSLKGDPNLELPNDDTPRGRGLD